MTFQDPQMARIMDGKWRDGTESIGDLKFRSYFYTTNVDNVRKYIDLKLESKTRWRQIVINDVLVWLFKVNESESLWEEYSIFEYNYDIPSISTSKPINQLYTVYFLFRQIYRQIYRQTERQWGREVEIQIDKLDR